MLTGVSPIFVIGVPRSGTTLLRVLLDSHPNIAAGPETPWFCAHHARTVGALVEYLCEDTHGYCRNFDGSREEVFDAARIFVNSLLSGYARRKGKSRWAEKTPDNLKFLLFLRELFPDARFIHLRRNALDVGLSTSIVAAHRKGVTPFNETSIGLFEGAAVENNLFNAVLRWVYWERKIATGLDGIESLPVQYEDLVRNPETVMRRILEFAGEPWAPQVLNFMAAKHEFPAWEWGSADVVHYSGSTQGITTERTNRAEREIAPLDREILGTLLRSQDTEVPVTPNARLACLGEVESEKFTRFVSWYNSFAGPLGLQALPPGTKYWDYPWLWFEALGRIHWSGKTVIDSGSSNSALPWILALLGARVTLVEANEEWVPAWERLRTGLEVDIAWHISPDLSLPVSAATADVVLSLSSLERHGDKEAAIADYVRVLRPNGLLIMACGIGEPGMHFPPWFGSAVTIAELEELVCRHPVFEGNLQPTWNIDDIPAFRYWHLHTHEHRDFVSAAVILRRISASAGNQ